MNKRSCRSVFCLCKSGNKKAERDFTTTLRANLKNILDGESVKTEFKECTDKISNSVDVTICLDP